MIFSFIILFVCAILLTLDYSYLFKNHKISFLAECFIWAVILVCFEKSLIQNTPLYADGGVRVDILTFLLLSREAILSRVSRSNLTHDLTQNIRAQTLKDVILLHNN